MDINGSEVDLDLLPALNVLLEECNVTWAAQRLGLSQSALSAKLARLRRPMNDPLLVPTIEGRGMVLTPRAVALQAPLQPPLPRFGRPSALRSPLNHPRVCGPFALP